MTAPNSSPTKQPSQPHPTAGVHLAPLPAQTQWQRIAAKLQDSEHRKSEFLAQLSHELRNPLAPLSHGLILLRKHPDHAELVEQTAAMMQRQLGHVIGLIDDLLDLQRIALGKLSLKLQEVSLQDVVQGALEISAPLMQERSQQLSVSLPEAALWVRADPMRLTQVLSNLLINAAKYTAPGGQVRLRALALREQAQLELADTGAGIPADELAHIFEPYTQVRDHQNLARGGLGLGLALARQLLELHGGQISASSPGPGLGSTFCVKLPLCNPPVLSVPNGTPQAQARAPLWRILVVDDNADSADTLAAALQCCGHQALAAHDGPSALARIKDWRPQVALVDLSMPGMDGFELARQLQLLAQPAALVAMTGWGTATDRERCEKAGFAAHIVKPASVAQIEETLLQVLQVSAESKADQRAERRSTA
jgi:CheY-like chemotaxis protein/nitrogen-specific signal transduction histidine kinase